MAVILMDDGHERLTDFRTKNQHWYIKLLPLLTENKVPSTLLAGSSLPRKADFWQFSENFQLHT